VKITKITRRRSRSTGVSGCLVPRTSGGERFACRLAADVADVTLREGELDDHGQQHADAGAKKPTTPAVRWVLAERRADERREEGTGVDAHVEA
jgi:hypothetical protein